MNNWNKLLNQLDATIGFPNRKASTVNLKSRGFDQRTGEYTFWLEYRTKVNLGTEAPEKTAREIRSPRDLHNQKGNGVMREWQRRPLAPAFNTHQ